MVDHVVLFRLRADAPEEHIDRAIEAIQDLASKIPKLISIRAGRNFSPRGQSHRLMLVSQFNTRNDLDVYVAHPAHQMVVKTFIEPIREDVLVGDIEY